MQVFYTQKLAVNKMINHLLLKERGQKWKTT